MNKGNEWLKVNQGNMFIIGDLMIRKSIMLLTIGLSFGTYILGMHESVFMGRGKRPDINSEFLWKYRQAGNYYSGTYCTFDLNSLEKECFTGPYRFVFPDVVVSSSSGIIEEFEFAHKVIDANNKFAALELEYFKKEAQKETSEEVVTKRESFIDQEVSYQVGSDEDCRFCLKKSNEDPECWRSVRTNRWFFPTKKMKINPALYYAFKQMYENQQQADLEKSFE